MADIRYLNTFAMPGGFNISSGEPIDSRAYVADITHIYSDENWETVKPYPGLIVSAPDGQVRICVNSDYKQESSWLEIGGGKGTITADDYAAALKLAQDSEVEIGQMIYALTSYTDESGESAVTYGAGLYVVNAVGENAALSKIGTTTASGNVEDAVAKLQTDLGNITNRVAAVEGKLEGIAEGAQVNVIEEVKVNGVALEVTDKSVDITIEAPVYAAEVAETEENAPKASAVYSFVKNIEEGLQGSIEDLDKALKAVNDWKLVVVSSEDASKENFGIETPDTRTFYLVPNDGKLSNNIYDEYIYVNGAWEKLGELQLEFDPSQLVSRISTLEEKVNEVYDEINTENTGLKALIAKAQAAAETAQGKADANEREINTLKETVNEVYDEINTENNGLKALIAKAQAAAEAAQGKADEVDGKLVDYVKFTDVVIANTYDEEGEIVTVGKNGAMSIEDKEKLDAIGGITEAEIDSIIAGDAEV